MHRAIYDAIMAHLRELGPVHGDVVAVGVFLKRDMKFAEVRPKKNWIFLDVVLPQPIMDRRITRRASISASRIAHGVKLHRVEDVDDEVRSWLTEAFLFARLPS
jgi:hypothetical protein